MRRQLTIVLVGLALLAAGASWCLYITESSLTQGTLIDLVRSQFAAMP